MRVLLTESASLTCRETLTVLGRRGVMADIASSGRFTIGEFSRWRGRRMRLPLPAIDPVGYVRAIGALCPDYDAILPTHEQAWLLAAGRHLLPGEAPLALAPIEAFDRVQSKLEFARFLDELGIPQPRWWLPGRPSLSAGPVWVKASFGTAGTGTRLSTTIGDMQSAVAELSTHGGPVICQEHVKGEYGQAQTVFDRGRMVAAHTSVAVGVGVGGSAAARLSVEHPDAREMARQIGQALRWHGGLTIDYVYTDVGPLVLECNPRMVEPGNAAAAGLDLPRVMIAVSRGEPLPAQCLTGRAGVRTHSALALVLGAASSDRSRRAVLAALGADGGVGALGEVATPIREDPLSAVPLGVVLARVLARPRSAVAVATGAVDRYAIRPEAVGAVRRSS